MATVDGGNCEANSTSLDVNIDENAIPSVSCQSMAQCESSDTAAVDNSLLDMPTLERHDSVETVLYTSPVPKNFLEVGDSYNKDVKDSTAVPGTSGLYNLGNTCFMNSGLVSLACTTPLVRYMLNNFHLDDSNRSTLTGQFYRLLCKMWCGQYSIIHPLDFKETLGLYHPQFHDYRQHDCQEFLALLLDSLHEQLHKTAPPLQTPNPASTGHLNNTETALIPSTSQPECSPSPSPTVSSRPSPSPPVSSSPPYSPQSPSCSPPPAPDQAVSSSQAAQAAPKETAAASGSPGTVSMAASACVSSTTTSTSPSLQVHSEDSNHSSVSSQSTDSEQSAALRNKLRLQFGDVPKSSEADAAASAVSSSSDVHPRTEMGRRGAGNGSVTATRCFAHPAARISTTISTTTSSSSSNAVVPEAEQTASPVVGGTAAVQAQPAQLNNAPCSSDFSRFHDFLSKETKTLNTNVLVSDLLPDSMTVDSDKFAKQDNRCLRPLQEELILPEEVVAGDEDKTVKMEVSKEANFLTIKDVNVRAERKLGAKQSISTLLSLECSEGMEDLNNVKRIKMDTEAEKNVQLQELSKFNTRKSNIDCDTSVPSSSQCDTSSTGVPPTEASDPESSGESMEVEDAESSDEDGEVTSRSSTVDDVPTTTSQGNVLSQQDLQLADSCWRNYLLSNNSIITSTFQGQFRSMVTCMECGHVSVTYEPFMYLTLPIPHAMERQICVIFVSTKSPPVRYLLTLHKNDTVAKLKRELCVLIGQEIRDIILAEVYECHISRTVEDNVMLRYVNDTNRLVYAFEMPSPESVCQEYETPKLMELPNPLDTEHWVAPPSPNYNIPSPSYAGAEPGSSDDIFTNVETFQPETLSLEAPDLEGQEAQTGEVAMSTTVTTELGEVEMQEVCDSRCSPDHKTQVLGRADPIMGLSGMNFSEVSSVGVEPENSQLGSEVLEAGQVCGQTEEGERPTPMEDGVWDWDGGNDNAQLSQCWASPVDSTTPCTPHPPSPVTSSLGMGGVGAGEDLGGVRVVEHWRACAICLEELPDSELLVHLSCDGTYCQNCLEMSIKHSGDSSFSCPTCQCPTDVTTDFVPLATATAQKPKLRVMVVCVAFRYENEDTGRLCLFGHPCLVYLPNHISGKMMHQAVSAVLPFDLNYSLHLTDGQGLHCSRCGYLSQCVGCEVGMHGELELRPSDHITVHCRGLSPEQLEAMETVQDHSSMQNLRPDQPLTIYDCFRAFTEIEVLDEQNPWYCSQCERNQCAKKIMTVWRYPDYLIIHLKRFCYHDLSSTKVDSKVVFPHSNFDLNNFTSRPDSKGLTYDLYSYVNHYGGSQSGHYTTFSRNPTTSQWYYHNDENVTRLEPREDDYTSAYLLFYQRQGTQVSFSLPTDITVEEEAAVSSTPKCAISSQAIPLPPPSLDVAIPLPAPHVSPEAFFVDPTPEPDSTLDYYS